MIYFFAHSTTNIHALTGRKFRIYPTAQQAIALPRCIGCQRVIRNAKVEETNVQAWLRRFSKFSDRSGDEIGGKAFDQAYSHFDTELNPWLREVPSQILRNVIYRAKAAFVRYWKGEAKKPVFRGEQREESVLLTEELFRIEGGKLHVGTHRTPLGEVRWKAHREFQTPKMLTITRCGDGAWFASFICEDGIEAPTNDALLVRHSFSPEPDVIAFDRGVAHALADSEGEFHDLEPERTAPGKASSPQRKAPAEAGPAEERLCCTAQDQEVAGADCTQKTRSACRLETPDHGANRRETSQRHRDGGSEAGKHDQGGRPQALNPAAGVPGQPESPNHEALFVLTTSSHQCPRY